VLNNQQKKHIEPNEDSQMQKERHQRILTQIETLLDTLKVGKWWYQHPWMLHPLSKIDVKQQKYQTPMFSKVITKKSMKMNNKVKKKSSSNSSPKRGEI